VAVDLLDSTGGVGGDLLEDRPKREESEKGSLLLPLGGCSLSITCVVRLNGLLVEVEVEVEGMVTESDTDWPLLLLLMNGMFRLGVKNE
jgi:hypothetical protein